MIINLAIDMSIQNKNEYLYFILEKLVCKNKF